MENNQDILSLSDNPKKLPEMLNVLTILTFIGSGLGVIMAFLMPLMCKVLDMEEVVDKMKPSEIENIEKMCTNMTTLVILTILGSVLCLVGAFMMRKLKQTGLIIYIAGHIVPMIGSIALIGIAASFPDTKTVALSLVIPVVFIGLYLSQKKHLVN